ncbi:hypothetical protein Vafri_3112 [Volvox africanus]|uniref:Uncharacterized protein n=1 Tax=Volvox africanus TaxID=51714 RepID=A0A8J4AVH9_9CHLO|nr:hypothetical protein Vafri_3112 [Volvox africanus]
MGIEQVDVLTVILIGSLARIVGWVSAGMDPEVKTVNRADLYGKDIIQAGRIDMVLDAVSELRVKIRALVVERQMEDSAVQQYMSTVMATEEDLKVSRMQGPGLASLEYLLDRQRFSDASWVVGERPSLADFAVFDLASGSNVPGKSCGGFLGGGEDCALKPNRNQQNWALLVYNI